MNYTDKTNNLHHFYSFSPSEINDIAKKFGVNYNDDEIYWIFDKDKTWSAAVYIKDCFFDNMMAEIYPQRYSDEEKYKFAKRYWIARALLDIDADIEGFFLM